MLSEYRRESASNVHSDFYRFLYNKSKIKPLNKYFLTKTKAKYLKDAVSERNKIISNKDVDNKHLYSKVKEEEIAEERKILNWLANCDNETNDNAELDTKHKCNEQIKDDLKEMIKFKYNDNFKYNQFADNIVETDMHKTVTENRKQKDIESNTTNDINSLKMKKLINQDSKQDPTDISKMTKPKLLELDDNESIKILKDCSPESCKEKSVLKKSGQRKISDFFQREIS